MVEIGKLNKLKILHFDDNGNAYLDGGTEGELFLMKREVPEGAEKGGEVEVFAYRNAKRDVIVTAALPFVMPGQFGYLEATDVSKAGALLDWGLARPLFMPSREMRTVMKPERSYLVYVYYDENTKQIIATSRVERFLGLALPKYKRNDRVKVLVTQKTDIGYKCIVDDAYWGMIYKNQVYQPVDLMSELDGFVSSVREDGKVDVTLQKIGIEVVDKLGWAILDELERCGGFLALCDKSSPEEIMDRFGCSKKAFKKTIGALFYERLIVIEDNGIRLNKKEKK